MRESDRQRIVKANAAALKAAGLQTEPANVGLGGQSGTPKQSPPLAGFTGSSDPRLAAAARKRMEAEMDLPEPTDSAELVLPEETASLTEQSIEERRKNAVDLTREVTPQSPYED